MSDIRGLPLLSGPPPPNDATHAEIACRKCNKEFNIIFTRARKCNHCGYSYCHSCSDFQALMPRNGFESGYEVTHVCAYCVEHLSITAGGRGYLKSLSLAKLKKYINAYNIRIDRAVEKDDLIDAIIGARGANGCLSRENENFYRKYSVPNRATNERPRGLFSRPAPSSTPPNPPPRPPNRPSTYNFPRPDLAPDPPLEQQYPPPRGPPPQSRPAPPTPPRPQQPNPSFNTYPHYHPHQQSAPPPPPPRPQHNNSYSNPHQQYGPTPTYTHQQQYNAPPNPNYTSRPYPYQEQQQQYSFPSSQGPSPYLRPEGSRSSHSIPNTNSNYPRQRASSAAPPPTTTSPVTPPAPPPTLDELLNMSAAAVGTLSISALKSILFTNHVNAGMILEKSDLVKKVVDLVEEERRHRERQRMVEEMEERERVERQRVLFEEHRRAAAEREARARRESGGAREGGEGGEHDMDVDGGDDDDDGHSSAADATRGSSEGGDDSEEGHRASSSVHGESGSRNSSTAPQPQPLPPRAQAMAANLERTGLCVICQDDEANIAIVDCGHLAMCRGCSDLVMTSSRECPLCRTRIVTEARLLRIFKT